jgi:hypothetical protein
MPASCHPTMWLSLPHKPSVVWPAPEWNYTDQSCHYISVMRNIMFSVLCFVKIDDNYDYKKWIVMM